MIGTGVLYRSLYILEFALPFVSATLIVNTSSSSKRLRLNEKSSTLLHKCLGHISRQRTERLIKDEILPDLDFSYFNTCVDCIKGKLTTKVRNVKIDRCIELFRVIHTDICGSFTPLSMGGYKYFITFIDDYSRYVLLSLFVRSLNLWRLSKLSKLMLSSNKGRRSKWFDRLKAWCV